jgi:hypothetical protein
MSCYWIFQNGLISGFGVLRWFCAPWSYLSSICLANADYICYFIILIAWNYSRLDRLHRSSCLGLGPTHISSIRHRSRRWGLKCTLEQWRLLRYLLISGQKLSLFFLASPLHSLRAGLQLSGF